ncbi:integrase arm-type DNA-binding domain-containing protein [Moraxella nonliquefaciens]|uniref:tyrosine-type recombinase/integrase n=1 Tax=Moraxella nonliquefaciens TaxID=478 RepID=UPI001EF41D3F|nr:integrase arm-type DNA-binding domain-containing protein [Moraxella nonliquefaciens]MCG7411082.1 integrase arm-type DNA-binding domain-containing protein [Moraxella nonliquefaciens]
MKVIKPLTVKQIDNAKPIAKPYRLYDGRGLSLLIKSTAKIWHFNYQKPISKKRTVVSFGAYPIVSLADARAKRDEYLALLAQDIDPQAQVKQQLTERKAELDNTFYKVSQDWLSEQSYKSNTLDGVNRYLRYAYEFIKDKPVSDLTAFDILDICQAIHDTHGSLMASGVKTKIAQVLDFALSRRMVTSNVARGLKNTHKKHKKGHNPAIIDPKELGEFLNALDKADDCGVVVKTFLQIAPYIFVRPTELATMHKKDIDFDKKEWRYTPPKTEDSTKTQIIVPLSRQVFEKIEFLLSCHGRDYVFYSNRGKYRHITRQRPAEWLRDNGFAGKQTNHGLRATARTILEEELGYASHIIEMQLGHQTKDPNGNAYNRTKFLEKRKAMMQDWADYLDNLK